MTRHTSTRGPRAAGLGSRSLRWARGGLVALALAGGLAPAAARAEEEDDAPDGRLEGYASKVAYDKSSTVLTWFLFFLLMSIGLSALFKTAKRE